MNFIETADNKYFQKGTYIENLTGKTLVFRSSLGDEKYELRSFPPSERKITINYFETRRDVGTISMDLRVYASITGMPESERKRILIVTTDIVNAVYQCEPERTMADLFYAIPSEELSSKRIEDETDNSPKQERYTTVYRLVPVLGFGTRNGVAEPRALKKVEPKEGYVMPEALREVEASSIPETSTVDSVASSRQIPKFLRKTSMAQDDSVAAVKRLMEKNFVVKEMQDGSHRMVEESVL